MSGVFLFLVTLQLKTICERKDYKIFMKKQIIRKTQFKKLLITIGDETYQIVSEGPNWYEQLTDGEMVYQYKLMSSKELLFDGFWRNAFLPDKLMSEGKVYAYAYVKDNTINYYIVPGKKTMEREYFKAYDNELCEMASWNAIVKTASHHESR